MKKVTFGIVNCNRLYYLKSCLESLLLSTHDYPNKEIIVVDNASVERGTEEYLKSLESRGCHVLRQKERDPANEFAKGLNYICENATGDFICPLQGDMQFIIKGGWLKHYVSFASKYESKIGGINFDAQRNVRIRNNPRFAIFEKDDLDLEFKFLIDANRYPPVSGAGDVFYSKEMVKRIYPWNIKNKNHEGGLDSETHMLNKVRKLIVEENLELGFVVPVIPVAIAIYTDARGTMGRVRNNKRYGDYWEAKNDNLYYEMFDYDEVINRWQENGGFPLSIEMMAKPIGWKAPIDDEGNWIKNPIRPENCTEEDFKDLY